MRAGCWISSNSQLYFQNKHLVQKWRRFKLKTANLPAQLLIKDPLKRLTGKNLWIYVHEWENVINSYSSVSWIFECQAQMTFSKYLLSSNNTPLRNVPHYHALLAQCHLFVELQCCNEDQCLTGLDPTMYFRLFFMHKSFNSWLYSKSRLIEARVYLALFI